MAYFEDVSEYCDMDNIGMVDDDLASEWVKVSEGNNGRVNIQSVEIEEKTVPDLTGMNVMDAVYLLETMGWKAQFSGKGLVESQSVKAGTNLEKGKTVVLKLKV